MENPKTTESVKTPEVQITEFNKKLIQLFNEAPENYNLLIIGGTVEDNREEPRYETVNGVAMLLGSGRNLNLLIRSTMEKDRAMEKVLRRAVSPSPTASDISDILKKFHGR